MHHDFAIPPQVCPRCQRENLPLAQVCSCGQELGAAPAMPAPAMLQGIPAGLGMSPVSSLQPGDSMQPRSSLPRPAAAPFVADLTRRRRPRALRAAAVLGIGAVVVLVPAVFLGFLGSAQAEPAQSSSPAPGSSGSPSAGSSTGVFGSGSPAPGASGTAADALSVARLDAGAWAITHTVTASTLEGVQVGDRTRRVYDAKYACATPPCDLRVTARDPDSPAAAVVTTFTFAAGTYTAQEPVESERCILGDGAPLSGAYDVHITTILHASAVKQQSGHSVATQLEGSQLREGVTTATGAHEGCKPWRIQSATLGAAGDYGTVQMPRSVNWSGYDVQRKGARFTNVEGTWVQPTVSCQSVHRQMASFWVGIDGISSPELAQIGTSSECVNQRQDLYYAWWEMLPAPMVRIPILIRPGDTIHSAVSFAGTRFTLSIKNVTLDNSFSIARSNPSAKRATAEWVAEATSMCGTKACEISALPDFGTVRFTDCSATANGQTALLGDELWTRRIDLMIQLKQRTVLKALPSAIDAASDGFTVSWRSVGP